MTVPYSFDISSSSPSSFLQVIFRWKGSVWKSVFVEFFVWLLLYYIIFFIHRDGLDPDQKEYFEGLVRYVYDTMSYLPMSFLLGFFVTIVFDRWRQIFDNIEFIDNVSFYTSTLIRGSDEETIIARRNILRYICLTQLLVFRDVSLRVRKRFPNLNSVVDA
ncbi:bestrophin-3, partial [Aphelenchoides avenae]